MSHLQDLAKAMGSAPKDLKITCSDGIVETSHFMFKLRADPILSETTNELYMCNTSTTAVKIFTEYIVCAKLPTNETQTAHLFQVCELARTYNLVSFETHIMEVLEARACKPEHCCEIIYRAVNCPKLHKFAVDRAVELLLDNIQHRKTDTILCSHGGQFTSCDIITLCGVACKNHTTDGCEKSYCGAHILARELDVTKITCEHGILMKDCPDTLGFCLAKYSCKDHVAIKKCPSTAFECTWFCLNSRWPCKYPMPANINKYMGVADIIMGELAK